MTINRSSFWTSRSSSMSQACGLKTLVCVVCGILTYSAFAIVAVTGSMPDVSSDVLNRAQDVLKGQSTKKLGACRVCRLLVDSFERGLKDTSRGKFEGGDADWESSRLGSYADSELRLVEVQEKLCNDISTGKDQCHNLSEESESDIEHWWFNKRKEDVPLYDFLCTEKRKACCPTGTFGPDCTPCAGFPDKICSNHGQCHGNGTRTGSGKCTCDSGYTGDKCDSCGSAHFQSNQSSAPGQIICEPCDKSCLGYCRDKGPKGCEVCSEGYLWDQDYGCLDIDECIELGYNPCQRNTFCVNTEGSYTCFECDKSCDGCNGDGPDMCKTCAEDYALKNGFCSSIKKKKEQQVMEFSRYGTYLGLCLATCIIFRKNIYIASVIGLAVATYIGVAEYTIGDAPPLNPLEALATENN